MAEHNPTSVRDNPDVRHEQSDVSIRGIVIFAAGLLVAAIVIHIGLYWLLEFYKEESPQRAPVVTAPGTGEQFPPPRLQISPRADMAEMRAAQERRLTTYGWVDKEKQIVRIPIDRAMELLVQRGLPARKLPEKEARKK
jgi:hypothetical protein